jgi:peptide deformylase
LSKEVNNVALREIITVGNPKLRQVSRPVRKITPRIRKLIDDMVETMHAEDGIGLAAVQVGELRQIIVVEVPEHEEIPHSGERYIVVNPEIVKDSHETLIGIEGCLSVPGFNGEVERAEEVIVRGLDEYGKPFRARLRGFVARVFQHEIDHCEGVLYIDRLTAPDRIWSVPEGEEELAELEQQSPLEDKVSDGISKAIAEVLA